MQRIVTVLDTALTVNYNDRPISTQKDLDTYKFEFDDSWQGYVKTAVFYTDRAMVKHLLIPEDGVVTIPWEILIGKPKALYIGAFGTKDTKVKPTTFGAVRLREGSYIDGIAPLPPTPDVYQQIISAWEDAKTEEEVRVVNENSRRNNFDALVIEYNALKAALEQEITDGTASVDALQVLETQYAAKALALETTYAPRLGSVESQMAENESKTKLTDWELQNKKRKQKPIFTIVDDDGHNAVLTQLLPLANQYGFKFTTTVIGNSIILGGNARFMKIPDLISLQNQGHEISSHTYTHDPVSTPAKVDALTEADFENEFSQMDVIAKANGLKFNTLVYPGGARNDLEISVARKYYRAARTTEYGINTMPIETWDLKVLNGYTAEYNAYTTNAQRLAYLKLKVDEMIANNGWGIFVTHLYLDVTQVELLEGLVQYVQSKGIEIVTLNEGLNRYGNVVDIGRYVKRDLTKKHLAVAPDGSFSGSELQSVAKSVTGAPITFTTPPKDVPRRSILISSLLFSQSAGMPEAQGGVLITTQYRNYLADDIGSGLVRQQYRVNSTNHVYERYSIDDNTWSAFERINIIKVIPTNTVTVTTPYSSFPKNCMSKCKITTTTGFPENSTGILTTDRIGDNTAYTTQTYDIADSGTSYKRFYDYTVSGWSAFRRTTIVAKTTAQRNGASFPKNIGDMVFDTTLGKAIWYNGTAWIDSAGTTV